MDKAILTLLINEVTREVSNKTNILEERLIIALRKVYCNRVIHDEQTKIKIAIIGVLKSYPENSHEYNRLNYEIDLMEHWGRILMLAQKKSIKVSRINVPKKFKPIGIINLWEQVKKGFKR